MSDGECWTKLRFRKRDLRRVADALGIPEKFVLPNRSVFDGEEALLFTLAHFASNSRLHELVDYWGRDETQLSRLFRCVCDFLYENHAHLLRDNLRYWSRYMPGCVEAIAKKAKVDLDYPVWAFIDGTQLEIRRPTGRNDIQREVYSGHKRMHALKFQGVIAACGLVADLSYPVSGRRHDAFALRESKLNERMAECQTERRREEHGVVYGDAGYPVWSHIIGASKGANMADQQIRSNRAMSSLRITVEWMFGGIQNICPFLSHDKKLFAQPVGRYYVVAALLYNCRCCLYGNEISEYFEITPPTLESYLNGAS